MNSSSKHLTCEQTKEMDLVDYLASINLHPTKISHADYWYISPFRDEKTASFKVNRPGNVWFDHGEGIGGTIIDFGIKYFNCSIPDLLEKLSNSFLFQQSIINYSFHQPVSQIEHPIAILSVQPIQSLELQHYLSHRKIALDIATKYCRQVAFKLNDRTHQALGFPSDKGGYELRSPNYKGSNSPKAVTTIQNGSQNLVVFEGFFDFLSYCTINKNQSLAQYDFLVLNSTAFLEKNRPFMDTYPRVNLYLDNDSTGKACTTKAQSWGSQYADQSHQYSGYKDLNEWLIKAGHQRKQSTRQRP